MAPKCKLCLEKEANQTGSHIFTQSLISACTNAVGEKGRDKEVMFTISQKDSPGLFVGRKVATDKVEEVKGKPMSDEEIAQNKNNAVYDYVFCTSCEKLFGKVESSFAAGSLKEIRTKNILEIAPSEEIRLYFIIQVWRAAACNYDSWKIDADFQEYLRKIVFEGCSQHGGEYKAELSERLKTIPLVITILQTKAGEESSNIVMIPNNTEPHVLFLCDFVVQIYKPRASIDGLTIPPYHNLNTVPSHGKINYKEDKFVLGTMKDDERVEVMTAVANTSFAGQNLNKFIERFIAYCRAYTVEPDLYMIKVFATTLTQEKDIASAYRYSDDRIHEITKRILGV